MQPKELVNAFSLLVSLLNGLHLGIKRLSSTKKNPVSGLEQLSMTWNDSVFNLKDAEYKRLYWRNGKKGNKLRAKRVLSSAYN